MGTAVLSGRKMRYLVILSQLCSVLAQDTFYCPDGWHKYDGRAGCNCFWLAEYEMVTRDDASVLCSFHEAYVAELDGPALNYWLKGELLPSLTWDSSLSSGWELSQMSATVSTTPGSGSGPPPTRPSSGSTGPRGSPTTCRARTASP